MNDDSDSVFLPSLKSFFDLVFHANRGKVAGFIPMPHIEELYKVYSSLQTFWKYKDT